MTGSLGLLTVVAGCGAAAEVVALAGLLWLRPAALVARNYRGRAVMGRAGLTLAAPLAVVVAGALLVRVGSGESREELLVSAAAIAAFGLLGWLDDSLGDGAARGVRGHLLALVNQRRITTGLVKAVGGGAVGVWAAWLLGSPGWAAIAGGALVAVSANAINSLDVRPGRAGKAFGLAAIAILVLGLSPPLHGSAVALAALLGGVLVLLWADLGEKVMLGDTGANALGCALGLAAMALSSWPVWLVLAAALAGGCLAADRWSLSAFIERTPPLRWLDDLGRPPASPDRGPDDH